MSEIVAQFGINPWLLAAQIVNFLVLLWLLKRMFYQPLLKIIEERRRMIAQSLERAAEIERKLEQVEQEQSRILNQAEVEAKKVIAEATKKADELIKEAEHQARTQAAQILHKAKLDQEAQRRKLYREIKAELAQLVVTSLEKILEDVLDQQTQRKIIQQTLRRIHD